MSRRAGKNFGRLKVLLLALLFLCAADQWTAKAQASSAAVSLNKKTVILKKNKTVQLKLKHPGKGRITWSSSNPKVASVTAAGKVRAKADGACRITASYKGKAYRCSVYVTSTKRAYEGATALNRVKVSENKNRVVLAGSSSIVRWNTASETLAPLKTIKLGVNGSKIEDWMYWFPDMVKKYHPRAIVLYVGGNGIQSKNVSGAAVGKKISRMLNRLSAQLPDAEIYFISTYPTPERKAYWKQTTKSNQTVQKTCEQRENLHYIDIVSKFYQNGKLRQDLFSDRLHLNSKGYKIFNSAVRSALIRDGVIPSNSLTQLP